MGSEMCIRDRYYALSRAGRTRLARETESWTRLSAAITQVVQLTRA